MKEIQRVMIVGAGAVGAAVASIIHRTEPENLAILADAERRTRYAESGFLINGRRHDFKLVGPDDAWEPDLVLVAVKHQQLPAAIDLMKDRIGADTVVLSLLNGIESEATIGAALGVAPPYAMILGIDAVRLGNEITFASRGRIFFGEAANPAGAWSERVTRVARYFDKVGIAYVVPADMLHSLWFKFMINVGINQVSAVLRAPYGAFRSVPEAGQLMEAAMREAISLSVAAGVPLDEADLRSWYDTLAKLDPDGKTSMLQDVEAHRKTEVDMFAGTMIALGERYGIAVPANRFLYLIIKAMEALW